MEELSRLNQYRIMWVFVFFDLPTDTKKDRKNYALFRKSLQKDGFAMLQYSIYIRHCNSRENADVHVRRVKTFLAPKGEIIIFTLTDKQFGMMEYFRSLILQNDLKLHTSSKSFDTVYNYFPRYF